MFGPLAKTRSVLAASISGARPAWWAAASSPISSMSPRMAMRRPLGLDAARIESAAAFERREVGKQGRSGVHIAARYGNGEKCRQRIARDMFARRADGEAEFVTENLG